MPASSTITVEANRDHKKDWETSKITNPQILNYHLDTFGDLTRKALDFFLNQKINKY